jgi:FG-GAP repeat
VTPPGSLDAVWTEQSVITPFEPQQADLFGSSLMVSGNTALIGAPNRDWFYSGINGGAAFFMDLSYLNVRFSAREYTVSEGAEFMTVRIDHCIPQCQVTPGPSMTAFSTPQQPVLFRTLDGDVFPIYDTTGSVPPSSSFVRSRSPAVGRLDCTLQSIAHVSTRVRANGESL